MTTKPRLVHLVKLLSGMHLTCLSYLEAPELRFHYNPFEVQAYLKVVDALEKTIRTSHPEMLLKVSSPEMLFS